MRPQDPGRASEIVVESVRRANPRGVVAAGWAGLAASGDHVLVVEDVPHDWLFPQRAAVVHHGGAGTTTTAARAGAPQLVVPQGGDQVYWARRVAELDIGAAHDGPTPTVQSLSVALRSVLSQETRARATAVAGDVGTDGARTAAGLLIAGDDDGVERPAASRRRWSC